MLRAAPGTFLHQARASGVPAHVARLLEAAAQEVCPQQPTRALESRELFERTAMHAAAGRGGNLELSFRTVDALAASVETLGLARASEVPDPLRRVWVESAETRRPGVILACAEGEVAVLCPPRRRSIPETGSALKLSYRGFASKVEYDLRLDDPVRLPRGLILNLTRPEGRGAIGRAHQRFPVYLQGRVRANAEVGDSTLQPCEILDFSVTGVRMECAATFASGDTVWLELTLTDRSEPFATSAVVRWARADGDRRSYGLLFSELSLASRERLDPFVATLRPC